MSPTARLISKARRARLALRPPVSADELTRFETQADVRIPEDYREFLLQVGDGSPERGRLVSLSDWDASYWIDHATPAMAAQPCLLTPESSSHGADWLNRLNVAEWEARWDRGDWSPMFGTIAIVEFGCGLFYSLVMTGPFRGRVFLWGDHALLPPQFCEAGSFGEWLEPYLDRVISGGHVYFLDGQL